MYGNQAIAQPPEETSMMRLIELARELTSVLDREINLLRQLEISSIQELSEQKAQLTEEYRLKARELQENPGFTESLEPRLRDELEDVVDRLSETARANENALKAAMDAHDRVFRAIAGAVEAQRREGSGYSASGQHSSDQTGSTPVSLRINESL